MYIFLLAIIAALCTANAALGQHSAEVGQRYIVDGLLPLKSCPGLTPLECPGGHFDFIERGTRFTVLAVIPGNSYGGTSFTDARVSLDDGRTGFFRCCDGWQSEADAAAAIGNCRRRSPAAIGMTERQAYDSRWGAPYAVNHSTTAAGERAQWVYKFGPMCKDDGTPNHDGSRAYLYFDDGVLAGIQQFGD